MLQSMTAFSRCSNEDIYTSLTIELRSVNQRYLEITIRLPDNLRPLETAMRNLIQQRLNRGKIECTLRLNGGVGEQQFTVDSERAKALVNALKEIDHLLYNPAAISAIDLLNWPGVLKTEAVDETVIQQAVMTLLEEALQELIAGRRSEGEKIAVMIKSRIEALYQVIEGVTARLPAVLQHNRQRLTERLGELQQELNQERLEQEMALIANRLDVDEELDRLKSHLQECSQLLDSKLPVGRKLDFLMQELNREANTLGSKSGDLETTRAAVEMKVLLEQIREQVQNIE
ncbi:MAG: YicC family protein [Gammaproteobacteria bacterium]|nr:YicC family protein [Gammaproteobacteria bacterium]